MDPETQRLGGLPRSLNTSAFFVADRGTGRPTLIRVNQFEVEARSPREDAVRYETDVVGGRRDRPGVAPTVVTLPVFPNKHAVVPVSEPNPLPHARRTAPGKTGVIDPSVAGWKDIVHYTLFFNAAARALTGAAADPPLLVHLLFGTGTEFSRHGVCGALEGASDPILLVDISGIEPEHDITFRNPADATQQRVLTANNRWGAGITTAVIEREINLHYGSLIRYSIQVCAGFSTGYLGVQGSIAASLFPLSGLTRVVIYDCLYATLKPALDRVKAAKPAANIIAYVITSGGNSFRDPNNPTFDTLVLGGNRAWNYINLMGNPAYHAMTSARLVNEARPIDARILDPLPATYEASLNGMVTVLPTRNTVISDEVVFRRVKGAPPPGTTTLNAFASKNASAIRQFFPAMVGTTRRCIGRARLLGWPTPPGEEWHDMHLIEFAWEYLT